MGLFSEARRNFIARPDEARQDIIYKYPEHNVRMMTQLTCQPDEMAIFVNEGKVVGKLGPGGTYSLDSKNIPFLSRLLEVATGGNLFVSEIYFVSMREVTGVKFGGPLGPITDNLTQLMCDTMVFGDFSVQVTDAEKLLFGMVGSGSKAQTGNGFLDWFKAILLKHLSDAVGELGDKQGWPLNKMLSPSNKLELQKAILEQIREEIERYGIRVVQFGNFVLSVSDSDKAELNRRNASIADDQRRMAMAKDPSYLQVAQAQALRDAASGMAKGGDGGGAALGGLGLAMGMQMAQSFAQPQPPQAAAQGIKCPSCGQLTPGGKFCSQCGKPFVAKCACGTELPPGGKFCPNCGKPA